VDWNSIGDTEHIFELNDTMVDNTSAFVDNTAEEKQEVYKDKLIRDVTRFIVSWLESLLFVPLKATDVTPNVNKAAAAALKVLPSNLVRYGMQNNIELIVVFINFIIYSIKWDDTQARTKALLLCNKFLEF